MVLIRGAGDIASGIALRLYKSGYSIIMTELEHPTSIRRSVCFSEAVRKGETTVEGIRAIFCNSLSLAFEQIKNNVIPIVIDNEWSREKKYRFDSIVDARLAKINIDTSINDSSVVIGIGPGFTASEDCHAVIETKRGHSLGRVYYNGTAIPNSGIPGDILGFTEERILRSPCSGVFHSIKKIGDYVNRGDVCAYVGNIPVCSNINGVIRGLLPENTTVPQGFKSGDVDPRADISYCYTVSDKALAVAGGVLESLLHFNVKPDLN